MTVALRDAGTDVSQHRPAAFLPMARTNTRRAYYISHVHTVFIREGLALKWR